MEAHGEDVPRFYRVGPEDYGSRLSRVAGVLLYVSWRVGFPAAIYAGASLIFSSHMWDSGANLFVVVLLFVAVMDCFKTGVHHLEVRRYRLIETSRSSRQVIFPSKVKSIREAIRLTPFGLVRGLVIRGSWPDSVFIPKKLAAYGEIKSQLMAWGPSHGVV